MNKIVITTDSKATKRIVVLLQKFIPFRTLSFRIPKRIRSVLTSMISTYYDKAVMTSLMNDLYWHGMSVSTTNTPNGANITYHRISPEEYQLNATEIRKAVKHLKRHEIKQFKKGIIQ